MTRYWLLVRYDITGLERRYDYASATERALQVIMLSPYVTVVGMGDQ